MESSVCDRDTFYWEGVDELNSSLDVSVIDDRPSDVRIVINFAENVGDVWSCSSDQIVEVPRPYRLGGCVLFLSPETARGLAVVLQHAADLAMPVARARRSRS
jgi:hypothetical protein